MDHPRAPVEGAAFPSDATRLARNRRRETMLGLVLSFLGLALVSLVLPVSTPSLVRALPLAGAGLALLWTGGILMGNGRRPFGRRGRRPAADSPVPAET